MSDLTNLTAEELAAGYRAKQFTATEVTDAHLARIEAGNKDLNIYLEVYDDAQAMAKKADTALASGSAHALTGVPIAIKDNIMVKGKIASAGSNMLRNHTAVYDATCITRLKDAGAVFLGRVNMDEFAMGTSTEHSAYGPTRNPVDPTRVPGGTSGGSAAAVAANMAPIALGTDTGGSVRQPSALCGVYGFKPTYGGISRYGLVAMGSSLDQLGIVARNVSDIETTYKVVSGIDVMDGTTLPEAPTPTTNKRIAVPRAFIKDAQPDVVKEFERGLEVMAKAGYEIVDVELPVAPHALAAYYIIMPAELSTNLARFDGMRYGLHKEGAKLLDDYKLSRAAGFGAEARRRIILGTYVLSAGYYDAYYKRACALRSELVHEFDGVFKDASFIATPTAPGPAFKIGEKLDPLSLYLEDIFTVSANLAGIPAISVPCGTVEREGKSLPVGIQFMSPKRTESALFRVARDVTTDHQ
ncbi:MAG: Asp-tRNA(Asn)/Glu-tRNA(Gln) amidotransferase subunit GatA [Patescibacteria group bacterium]